MFIVLKLFTLHFCASVRIYVYEYTARQVTIKCCWWKSWENYLFCFALFGSCLVAKCEKEQRLSSRAVCPLFAWNFIHHMKASEENKWKVKDSKRLRKCIFETHFTALGRKKISFTFYSMNNALHTHTHTFNRKWLS